MTNPVISGIHNGDCIDVMKQIPSGIVDMVLADLPYGTTKCSWDVVIPFDSLWREFSRICKKDATLVFTASQPFTSLLITSNLPMFRYCWVWNKAKAGNFASVKNQPLKIHEDIVVFGKVNKYQPIMNRGKLRTKGGYPVSRESAANRGTTQSVKNDVYYPKSILDFSTANNTDSRLHPTQKPVSLFEYLIETYTSEGDLVLDNCMGSGTTCVACKNTKRRFIGIEKEIRYYEIARTRLEGGYSHARAEYSS